MNKKGQALIEFVLILPIFLFILFAIIDFGMIFSTKSNLENDSNDIINLFKSGTSLEELKEIYDDNDIDIYQKEEYYTFSISTSVKLITPGFNRIFGETLVEAKAILPEKEIQRRLPGLDGNNKMSKSLGNCIYLCDDSETVKKKVMSMYTDPNHIKVSDPGKVENNTVFIYLEAFVNDEHFKKERIERKRKVGIVYFPLILIRLFHISGNSFAAF